MIADEIDSTFIAFADRVSKVLGNLKAVILFGSAALDDFRPGKGDLDFMVITGNPLSASDCENLFALHDDFRENMKGTLFFQLEGTYYPLEIAASPKTLTSSGCYIGTSRKGWKRLDRSVNSLMDYKIIGLYGKFYVGEHLKSRIYNPSQADLLAEIKHVWSQVIHDAERMTDFGWIASTYHWFARSLYFLSTGTIGSKTRASEWLVQNLVDVKWKGVVGYGTSLRYPYSKRESETAPEGFHDIKRFLIENGGMLDKALCKCTK